MAHRCPRCGGELAAPHADCPGCRFAPGDEVTDLSRAVPAGPWRRWAARMLDFFVEVFFIGFLYGLFSGPGMRELYANVLFSLLALLFDSALYAAFGNTPGKWLLGIKIVDADLRSIKRVTHFLRNLLVYLSGFGFGIPLLTLVTFLFQYFRVSRGAQASYDDTLGLNSLHFPCGTLKTVIAVLLLVAFILSSILLNTSERLN